jgi:hypothetical protein
MNGLLLGCDPEVFVSVGNYVVSPALLETEKIISPVKDDEKHPVYIDTSFYKWHMDGVAFELGFKQPARDYKEIYNMLKDALDNLKYFIDDLPPFHNKKLDIKVVPTIKINPSWYDLSNERIWQGFIFGCDADYDALLPDYESKTLDVSKHPYRYGGGHIHFSGFKELYENIIPAVKLQAITTGNFCVANSLFAELDRKRVLTYGRPGRYRQQKYPDGSVGMEYRSPSNSWILFSLDKMEELFSFAEKGVYYLLNPNEGEKIIKEYLNLTIEAITQYDKEKASYVLEKI